MHVARLVLMLADHHYSSLIDPQDPQRVRGLPGSPLVANTKFDAQGRRVPNQALDEHLLGVANHSTELCHALPRFEQHLPRLACHEGLEKRSDDPRFRWQDHAADTAAGMREAAAQGGAFIVNMASTGCGKTLANARVMYALADPQLGMRCSFALGLRTLTLQTGRAYRQTLKLDDDQLAIRVGGAASRELFEHYAALAEASGSASAQSLLDDGSEDGRQDDDAGGVLFEGDASHPLLARAFRNPAMRKLLAAPVLACTVDHLVPATESQRGGAQIGPMLRLMSADLVIDELDDFDIDDLPAVARLVHWAGMLGARVLVSSATLPPALVRGMFEAYRDGRSLYARNRGQRPGQQALVACAWIDEFDQRRLDCADSASFVREHDAFVARRYDALVQAPPRRRMELLPFAPSPAPGQQGRPDLNTVAAQRILEAITTLHHRHAETDPVTGRRVSIGLVRMANIEPLVEVALALYRLGAPPGLRLHLCAYHARYPLLMRSAIERVLDRVLDRRDPQALFTQAEVRERLDAHDEADQMFVVLGSPVTEVGRDHSYSWAVVEPSSMRSLIQLVGRVWRHQPERVCAEPNVIVLDHNLRFWRRPDGPAFCRPGFETKVDWPLPRKPLGELLRDSERDVIDARSRIRMRKKLQPRLSLVDLEHARLQATMLGGGAGDPPIRDLCAHHWWTLPRTDGLMAAVLQQQQPFRRHAGAEVDACLMPDEEGERLHLCTVLPEHERRQGESQPYIEVDRLLTQLPDSVVLGERIAPWAVPDYLAELTALAQHRGRPLQACGQRYGQVTLPEHDRGWRFHPALGFSKRM
ncbi:type I-F CRISPR-associated helicase Cas3f [Pseudorhodoferax sp.]|uniref:type I-F CRISPR-associated helicase Cas3f n=1 Tax=Pseudorhodoferax sp. TaxID=1993553 RepID=UPI0039E221AC